MTSRPRSAGRSAGLPASQLDWALVSTVLGYVEGDVSGHVEFDFAVGQDVCPEQGRQAELSAD